MDISTNYADSYKKFKFISEAAINSPHTPEVLPNIGTGSSQPPKGKSGAGRQLSPKRQPLSSAPA